MLKVSYRNEKILNLSKIRKLAFLHGIKSGLINTKRYKNTKSVLPPPIPISDPITDVVPASADHDVEAGTEGAGSE